MKSLTVITEIKPNYFLQKFQIFTGDNFRLITMWKTKNIQSLFPLKSNNYKLYVVLSKMELALVVHVKLMKQSVM